MRKPLALVAALALAFFLTGCDDTRQVTGQEFQAMLARNPESMRSTQYLGVKDGKAYLKVSEMSLLRKNEWRDTYYATEAANLPPAWLETHKPGQK